MASNDAGLAAAQIGILKARCDLPDRQSRCCGAICVPDLPWRVPDLPCCELRAALARLAVSETPSAHLVPENTRKQGKTRQNKGKTQGITRGELENFGWRSSNGARCLSAKVCGPALVRIPWRSSNVLRCLAANRNFLSPRRYSRYFPLLSLVFPCFLL